MENKDKSSNSVQRLKTIKKKQFYETYCVVLFIPHGLQYILVVSTIKMFNLVYIFEK